MECVNLIIPIRDAGADVRVRVRSQIVQIHITWTIQEGVVPIATDYLHSKTLST